MEKNIGRKDKNIRLGAGAALLILSLVLIATALTGSCLLYQVLGIDTIGDKINKHKK